MYVSGAGTAAARGFPDMSVLSLSELVDAVEVAARVSAADVIVDLDTGYGGAPTIRHAMRALESAGAAAVHIEDQSFPRRCGYLTSEPCVPIEEMQARLHAAQASETDLVLVARTDALLTEGVEAAIVRAIAYKEAGAELLMINGIRTLDELRLIADAIDRSPQLYNVSGSDRSPAPTKQLARELGVAVMIYPIQAARAAALAVENFLGHLAQDPVVATDELLGFSRYMDLAGWADANAFEEMLAADPESSGEAP